MTSCSEIGGATTLSISLKVERPTRFKSSPGWRVYSSHARSGGTNLVSLIAHSSRTLEPVPAHFSRTPLRLLSISWRPALGDSSLVRRRRIWPAVMLWMHLTKRCPIPNCHQTTAAHVLERFLAYQQVPG